MVMDSSEVDVEPAFSTGSIGLDAALGVGGLPYGRIVELYGPESSGKTTLTLHAIAEVQKRGQRAAFIDAEHAFDPVYASSLGVNLKELLISQPASGEEALDLAEFLASSGEVHLIVIDSVAALTPKAELDGDVGDHHVGLQARMMSKALRKLTPTAHRSKTTLVFINQLRTKIGVMFGSPETTTGGNALKFYASVRLDIRRISHVKGSDGERIASKSRVKVVKNKLAPPFRSAEVELRYGVGICRGSELLDLGETLGLINRSGAWFAFGDQRLGQGREKARSYLLEHQALGDELAIAVRGALLPPGTLVEQARSIQGGAA